jgi:hypothetical protein
LSQHFTISKGCKMITKLSGKFPSFMESNKCLMIGWLAGSFLLGFSFDLFDCVEKERGEFDKWPKKLSI